MTAQNWHKNMVTQNFNVTSNKFIVDEAVLKQKVFLGKNK